MLAFRYRGWMAIVCQYALISDVRDFSRCLGSKHQERQCVARASHPQTPATEYQILETTLLPKLHTHRVLDLASPSSPESAGHLHAPPTPDREQFCEFFTSTTADWLRRRRPPRCSCAPFTAAAVDIGVPPCPRFTASADDFFVGVPIAARLPVLVTHGRLW